MVFLHRTKLWRGTGEREPGSNGGRGEAGEGGWEMGYPREHESVETPNKFCNIARYFVVEKAYRGSH